MSNHQLTLRGVLRNILDPRSGGNPKEDSKEDYVLGEIAIVFGMANVCAALSSGAILIENALGLHQWWYAVVAFSGVCLAYIIIADIIAPMLGDYPTWRVAIWPGRVVVALGVVIPWVAFIIVRYPIGLVGPARRRWRERCAAKRARRAGADVDLPKARAVRHG